MNKVKIAFCCFISIITLGVITLNFSSVIKSQSNKDVGFSDPTSTSPQDSKFYSSNLPFHYNGENVEEFILLQPLPNIWIVLPDSNSSDTKINLSERATEVLYKHWMVSLEYEYLREFVGVSKDISYQKEDTILLQSFIDTKESLTKIPISSKTESRNFSTEEAYELLGIIRDNSAKLVGEIKQSVNK